MVTEVLFCKHKWLEEQKTGPEPCSSTAGTTFLVLCHQRFLILIMNPTSLPLHSTDLPTLSLPATHPSLTPLCFPSLLFAIFPRPSCWVLFHLFFIKSAFAPAPVSPDTNEGFNHLHRGRRAGSCLILRTERGTLKLHAH